MEPSMASNTGNRDSGRPCGDCTLCCTAVAVFHLHKPTGTPCLHLCPTGCSIYGDRPRECRDFECLWLKGRFDDDDRPDALGVVICRDFEPATGEETVCVAEPTPGAAERPRVQHLITSILARGETILVRSRERIRKTYPDGRVEVAEVDQQDPMLVNLRSPGELMPD
jgi:hypothetical protein